MIGIVHGKGYHRFVIKARGLDVLHSTAAGEFLAVGARHATGLGRISCGEVETVAGYYPATLGGEGVFAVCLVATPALHDAVGAVSHADVVYPAIELDLRRFLCTCPG